MVAHLQAQHREIETLLDALMAADAETRWPSFDQLRRHLAVHETTEQEIVHPRAAVELADGAAVVARRLAEERAIFEVVTALEATDADSSAFMTGVANLRSSLLAHMQAEEAMEFAELCIELGVRQARRMDNATRLAAGDCAIHLPADRTLSALLTCSRKAIHGGEQVHR
ncbi:Hemerythrin HHE cation binding domain-containing protein [Jatrophihabitans endophyticus]|uniref:Hemerythrin HHE cation binding domain-containing protein n=1 Tax=Jatrophihabitans endophyticus TaxID=1206085 RepID=A0A1M5IRE3_9ACTN|nr:hemerythrin domain-containing protein [Jatrophihabitans endophyticus]SHG30902.1 Hemerythrin HHE cation binding domain-containing protein [Jatrophihabitans endophyticus]